MIVAIRRSAVAWLTVTLVFLVGLAAAAPVNAVGDVDVGAVHEGGSRMDTPIAGSAVVDVDADEGRGVLDGRRLFYTDEERRAVSASRSTHTGNDIQDESGVESIRNPGSRVGAVRLASSEKPGKMASPHEVLYTARVTGERGSYLLVNDLPCRLALPERLDEQRSSVLLVCPGAEKANIELELEVVGGRLIVLRDQRRLGTLLPGQKLSIAR